MRTRQPKLDCAYGIDHYLAMRSRRREARQSIDRSAPQRLRAGTRLARRSPPGITVLSDAAGLRLLLRTFGTPALVDADRGSPRATRAKDLALLIYLRVEHSRSCCRSRLACLLWGEHPERKARHSLSQALGRLREVLGEDALMIAGDSLAWHGRLPCDAVELEAVLNGAAESGVDLPAYTGDFVADLVLGRGAEDFAQWADAKRAYYRLRAARWLDQRGEDAERRLAFGDALQLGLRAVQIEPLFEAGHRRVMRAWHAMGERVLALQHYRGVVDRLETSIRAQPDPLTRALAEVIDARPDPIAAPSSLAGTSPG